MAQIATVDELQEAFEEKYGDDRVHRVTKVPFEGKPGHYYFLEKLPTYEQLAQITLKSKHAEAALMVMNEAVIVRIGGENIARTLLTVPRRSPAIRKFRWVAHTHPLDQNNRHQMIARGATEADRKALAQVAREWGQESSDVILCKGGRVVRIAPFYHAGSGAGPVP